MNIPIRQKTQRQRVTVIGGGWKGDGGSRVIKREKPPGGVKVARRKRRKSPEAAEGRPLKQVQFAKQVEAWGFEGLEGLKQQLDQWSKRCVVCQFVGAEKAGTGRMHTIWECPQEAAEGFRVESKCMDCGIKEARAAVAATDQGGCGQCMVPQAVCARWWWDEREGAWVEDRTSRCQYERVLIPAMMAMAQLGRAEGLRTVGRWLRRDRIDPRGAEETVWGWFGKRVRWEGVEVLQAVVVLMMLARLNGVCWVLPQGD